MGLVFELLQDCSGNVTQTYLLINAWPRCPRVISLISLIDEGKPKPRVTLLDA